MRYLFKTYKAYVKIFDTAQCRKKEIDEVGTTALPALQALQGAAGLIGFYLP
jgi:hypothetical protein